MPYPPNKKDKLNITLTDKEENKAIEGAELTLYKIANVSEKDYHLFYEYVDKITCNASLDNLESSTLTNEIPIDFYLKVIFFFYLYNNGHLPMKVLEGEKPNDINSVNMFRQISRKIAFFNESTVINDIEDLLNEFYSGTNISYNIIIK